MEKVREAVGEKMMEEIKDTMMLRNAQGKILKFDGSRRVFLLTLFAG